MPAPSVAVFTRTTGYRHDSIEDGLRCLAALGRAHGFTVSPTEDPAELARLLPRSAAVVFLSTSGEVLTDSARGALRAFVGDGHGFVGIHSASSTEPDWPYYGQLIGARFAGHPRLQPGVVQVEDHGHPATAALPARWEFVDEWYDFDFDTDPRGRVRVLACADESTYEGALIDGDHPLVWCHESLGGRSFYTALGHTREAFADAVFRRHLSGGIRYAARLDD